ncbi:MAG: type I restriction-modification enzyme R subunit C-terminal domain-containing protein [Thiobacillus sp.]|nr:type I restriction-modification enzyme R subunit C-terminal domain-containing protein [Thiobacillus sp.]
MNEAETRAEHIDPLLAAAGWGVVEGSRIRREYALAPLTRKERAAQAHAIIGTQFNSKQQVFLDFVLSHYVSVGVEELDQAKLTPLLRLKYHDSIADAVADLGRPDEIGKVFSGFQKYLYQAAA